MIKNPLTQSWSPSSLRLDKNTEIVVRQKKTESLGTYQAIGKLNTVRSETGEDVFAALVDATGHSVLELWSQLLTLRCPDTNVVRYPLPFENRYGSEYQAHQRRVKRLVQADLIEWVPAVFSKKFKVNPVHTNFSQLFMINPNFVRCWHYEQQLAFWNELKS